MTTRFRQTDSAPTLDAFFKCMIEKQGILLERELLEKRFNKKTQNG